MEIQSLLLNTGIENSEVKALILLRSAKIKWMDNFTLSCCAEWIPKTVDSDAFVCAKTIWEFNGKGFKPVRI